MLAMWLSTFFSGVEHILLLQWSGQEWEESTSSFPEFSCSHCIISTSCLVFLPILPAWPISIYLKHDWQNTDNSPAPGVEYLRCKMTFLKCPLKQSTPFAVSASYLTPTLCTAERSQLHHKGWFYNSAFLSFVQLWWSSHTDCANMVNLGIR